MPRISPEKYFACDKANTTYKVEYYQGIMYAMAGASNRYNVIDENITLAIGAALRAKGCQ